MHTRWLRALRAAPLHAPTRRIATRSCRSFHASAPRRSTTAAPDGNADNEKNVPQQDEGGSNDPEKEKDDAAADGQNGDENLFGESITAPNGDGQGRKRRTGNGGASSLRARTMRNRTPEELPPVQLPKDFTATAIIRADDRDIAHERTTRVFKELVGHPQWSHNVSNAFDKFGYTIQDCISSGRSVRLRIDSLIAIAYWRAVCLTRELYGAEAASNFLDAHPVPGSAYLALLDTTPAGALEAAQPELKDAFQAAVETASDRRIAAAVLETIHPVSIWEAITTLRAEFTLEAPKNVKVSDLQRPITLINTVHWTGFGASRALVRIIAAELNADVLHLRAHDIAHIVGTYLGHDVVRAPSPISHLAYKAAENSGRSLSRTYHDNGDEDVIAISYTQAIRDEKLRKDSKKSVMTMDEFLNGTTNSRAKSDELWEDLKINSALEELIHSANSEDSAQQRPLLVHIDDYNAISMDLEAGSSIIGKIRKVIDGLWVSGRKIALVGTCSSKGAPKAYLDSLRIAAVSERLLTLHEQTRVDSLAKEVLADVEESFYLEENERNITDVLIAMLKPHLEESAIFRARALGLQTGLRGIDSIKGLVPKSWMTHVLPLTETYRVATTMIGLRGLDVFNRKALEATADLIKDIDEMKESMSKGDKDGEEPRRGIRGLFSVGPRKKENREEHEEQLLSGLVRAQDIQTTFDRIHAPRETIESIRMLTTLSLLRPEAFSYGVLATERIPGCLLYGPPGTGKTLLAKAVARESGANMIEVSAATINNMYVGESEKMVRALFQLAKKKEPLVIFIDEADALLGARGQSRDRAGSREVINQFLREWDGMEKTKAFIMVATNRPFDLDEAVLRRLPRKLLIDLPREKDRAEILKIHLRDEELDQGVDLNDLARRTPLYSGSDLKNVCVAAAMAAVKEELVDLKTGTLVVSPSSSSSTESNTNINTNTLRQEQQNSQQEDTNKEQQQQFKKRVLQPRHFDAALKEIGASVSEDMQTLSAIRRFDERYGDSTMGGGARSRRRRGMGFEVVPETRDTEGARIRPVFGSAGPEARSGSGRVGGDK